MKKNWEKSCFFFKNSLILWFSLVFVILVLFLDDFFRCPPLCKIKLEVVYIQCFFGGLFLEKSFSNYLEALPWFDFYSSRKLIVAYNTIGQTTKNS